MKPLQSQRLAVVFDHGERRFRFGNRRILDRYWWRLIGWRRRGLVGRLAIARIRLGPLRCVDVCSHARRDCTIDTAQRRARRRFLRGPLDCGRGKPAATGLNTGSLVTLSSAERSTESFA